MEFEIKGTGMSFEIVMTIDGVICEALVRMRAGEWVIDKRIDKHSSGDTYLAQARSQLWDVIKKATLETELYTRNYLLQKNKKEK